ncbi:MAG: YkvA family protein [Anaerolineae bacterium]
MNRSRRGDLIPQEDTNALLAWLQDVARQARLAWRLFWDKRVPLWTKLIPPAALAYVLFPVDIIPDVALGLGQLDDIAVLLLGTKLFIELAPPDVVREHLAALGAHIKEWRVVEEEEEKKGGPPAVIEGEYKVKEPEKEEAGTE